MWRTGIRCRLGSISTLRLGDACRASIRLRPVRLPVRRPTQRLGERGDGAGVLAVLVMPTGLPERALYFKVVDCAREGQP
jgi:hypothetical protein